MHELSIAISMVDEIMQSTEEIRSNPGVKVLRVHLSLGALSGVDEQALRFCYKAACEDTFLQGSELVVAAVPIVVHCSACMAETRPESIRHLRCGHCLAAGQVIQGHELEISALEVME